MDAFVREPVGFPPSWTVPPAQQHAPAELYVLEAVSRSVRIDAAAVLVGAGLREQVPVLGSAAPLRHLADMQQTVLEGPGDEASRAGRPVVITDLPAELGERWPLLADLDGDGLPIRSLAVLPVAAPDEAGDGVLGLLLVARFEVAPFDRDDLIVLAAAADLVARLLVDHLDGDGHVDPAADLEPLLVPDRIGQAVGRLVVRFGLDPGEAWARLRARAFACGETMHVLADRIVDGEDGPDLYG